MGSPFFISMIDIMLFCFFFHFVCLTRLLFDTKNGLAYRYFNSYKMESLMELKKMIGIEFSTKTSGNFSRIAIFIVFFWFGLLKIIGVSPAAPLVSELLEKTLPFLTFDQFSPAFGLYEVIIGVVFLFPRFQKVAITLLIPHLITTFIPLVLLPSISWQRFLVPTLEGQYIIKNIIIIALVLSFYVKEKSEIKK